MGLRPVAPRLIPALSLVFAFAAAAAPAPKPDPALDPAAVVRIQLEALAHVDEPARDAGIATVFRFASPGNQAQTGPLKHFADLIRHSYAEMLNHKSATLLPVVVDGNQALQAVELIDRAGTPHRYVFILHRQEAAPFKGCWMTDGVINSADEANRQET